jgi:hypothetical protein
MKASILEWIFSVSGSSVEVTRELMIRFVRINYELTELASGEVIVCLAVAEPARQLAGF